MKSRVLVGGTQSPPSTNLPRALGFAINHFSFQKNKRQSSSSSKRELFIQVFTFFCQKKKEVSGKFVKSLFFFRQKKKEISKSLSFFLRFAINHFSFQKNKRQSSSSSKRELFIQVFTFFCQKKKEVSGKFVKSLFFFRQKKKEISKSLSFFQTKKIWDSIRKCLRFK